MTVKLDAALDGTPAHSRGIAAVSFLCIAVPWLNPYAPGPAPALGPWLLSVLLAGILWGLSPTGTVPAAIFWGLAVAGAYVLALSAGLTPEMWMAAGACLIVTATAVAARPARRAGAEFFAAAWLAAALISSVIALSQYFDLAHHFVPLMNVPPPGEAFANLRQRNQFASLTAVGMASLLWWTSRGMKGGYAMPAMALLAVANAASASRTGLLQMLMLIAFMAVWPGPDRRKRLQLCLLGGAAYLVAAFVLPQMLQAFTGATAPNVWGRLASGPGCGSRTVLWSNVLHLIAQKPWLGWGWGELDYAHYITLYPGERFCDILDNAHNLPLHLAVELGIPFAVGVCGGFTWWVIRAKPWRETDATRQLAWAVLAIILFHSMLEYPLWYGPFQMAFGLCLGLLWRSPARRAEYAGDGPRWPAVVQRGIALVLIAAIGYAAWDYRRISQIYLPDEARAAAYRDDTLNKIRGSWLFRDQVRFAELTLTPLTRDNAQWTFDAARALLHFSPEPRVIEKVIESAVMLGRDDEAVAHLARYRAAFPADHAVWAAGNASAPKPRHLSERGSLRD
jgi:O-antigen ligase